MAINSWKQRLQSNQLVERWYEELPSYRRLIIILWFTNARECIYTNTLNISCIVNIVSKELIFVNILEFHDSEFKNAEGLSIWFSIDGLALKIESTPWERTLWWNNWEVPGAPARYRWFLPWIFLRAKRKIRQNFFHVAWYEDCVKKEI